MLGGLKTAVIGAGTMGHGIAQVCAQAGYEVKLVDISEGVLKRALIQIKENLAFFVESGILTSEESNKALSRIEVSMDLEGSVGDAEFVTEAIPEEMELKQKMFSRLDAGTPDHSILASNTSGLCITEIAKLTERPERVIGTNWWNPPHIIPLVEMMKGEKTSEETVQRTRKVLGGMGKKPVLILKPTQGFVGNRLQIALLREALSLLDDGVASAEDIDTAASYGPGFRYPVLGPFKTADFGGLDIFHHLAKDLYKDLDSSKEPQRALIRLVEDGKLGFKTGEGFYNYKDKDPEELLRERDRKLLGILRTTIN
jgi:3-hydroxybutyryl-CoA dehydrogenase